MLRKLTLNIDTSWGRPPHKFLITILNNKHFFFSHDVLETNTLRVEIYRNTIKTKLNNLHLTKCIYSQQYKPYYEIDDAKIVLTGNIMTYMCKESRLGDNTIRFDNDGIMLEINGIAI